MTQTPCRVRGQMVSMLLGVSVVYLWCCGVAEAGLSVSPTRVVLQGKPSVVLTGFFTLENQGTAPLQVVVEPEDWSGGIGGGRGKVGWLTVKPTALTLHAGKHARVKFTVRVPKDAHGELRTQVFFTMEGAATPDAMPTRSRLGTIIYVGIEGTEEISAEITSVKGFYTASTPGITQPDRLDLAIGIHNHSNAHIVPDGQVVIREERSQLQVATIHLQSGWGLLPNEQDTYHAIEHNVHLKPGAYLLDVTIYSGGDLRHPITVNKSLRATITNNGELHLLEDVPSSASQNPS